MRKLDWKDDGSDLIDGGKEYTDMRYNMHSR
jgi:hypothetical protein